MHNLNKFNNLEIILNAISISCVLIYFEKRENAVQSCVVNSQLFQKLRSHLRARRLKSWNEAREIRGKRSLRAQRTFLENATSRGISRISLSLLAQYRIYLRIRTCLRGRT